MYKCGLAPVSTPRPIPSIYGEGERGKETDSPLLSEVVMDEHQKVPPPVFGAELLLSNVSVRGFFQHSTFKETLRVIKITTLCS